MSWDKDASENLCGLRDRLRKDENVRKAFGTSFGFHTEDADVMDGKLPACVLYEEQLEAVRSAFGESDTGDGNMLSAVFYFDPETHSISKIEKLLGLAAFSLCEWTDEGLAIVKVRRTRATKPPEGQEAADGDADGESYRTIGLMVWFE
jgi:hypothetical protein